MSENKCFLLLYFVNEMSTSLWSLLPSASTLAAAEAVPSTWSDRQKHLNNDHFHSVALFFSAFCNIRFSQFTLTTVSCQLRLQQPFRFSTTMSTSRVCSYNLPYAYDVIKPSGDPSREKLFGGMTGAFYNEVLEVYSNGVHNVSVVLQDNNEACLLSMAKNQSDFFISHGVSYMEASMDFEHIYPCQLSDDTNILLISSYNMSSPMAAHYSDIFVSGVKEQDRLSVGMNALLIVMIGLMMRIARYVKNRKSARRIAPSPFEIFTHFVRQKVIEFDDFGRRFLAFLLTLVSFFAILFYTVLLSTEFVVIDKPVTIDNYNDIISRPSLKLLTADMANVLGGIANSRHGTKNRIFYDSVKDRTQRVSFTDSPEGLLEKYGAPILQGRIAMIGPSLLEHITRKQACLIWMAGFAGQMHEFPTKAYPYLAVDGQLESISTTYVMSQVFRQTVLGKRVEKNFRRATEAGIPLFVTKAFVHPEETWEKMTQQSAMTIPYFHNCITKKIVMPDLPSFFPLDMKNIRILCNLCVLLVMIAVGQFVSEIVRRIRCRRRRLRQARIQPQNSQQHHVQRNEGRRERVFVRVGQQNNATF